MAITILGAGRIGLIYHLSERPPESQIAVVSGIRVLAVIGGIFLLLGRSWARWLILAWLAFHVAVSAFHSISEAAAHAALLLAVGYFLLWPPGSKYFQSAGAGLGDSPV